MPDIAAVFRINMSGKGADGPAEADRYQAAIGMAEYADRGGFAVVNVEEHHDAEIGWLPSPLMMAGLIVPRTCRARIRASALLVTLYDPIRLAEDIAILDLASRGRFFFILGQGYREAEYHLHDKDWATRGAQTDFIVRTLLTAWKGEPFDYKGRTVHVSPAPFTKPHPPFLYGGMSKIAARRAAQYGLPFFPAQPMPELQAYYLDECQKLGHEGKVEIHEDMTLLFVDEDPDRAWAELGPCFLRETRQYSAWQRNRLDRHYQSDSDSVDALRAQGIYEIVTPEECLKRAASVTGRPWKPILHPLAGGIPIDRAWASMELFTEKVLKHVSDDRKTG